MSTWYCVPCRKRLQYRGVPRHRQMHREHGDGPVEMHTRTHIYTYDFRDTAEPAAADEENRGEDR